MQRVDGRFIYSASDLNNFLECRRLSELETLVALEKLRRPDRDDPQGDLIRAKGQSHEDSYLEALKVEFPGEVVSFERAGSGLEAYRQAERETLEAMRSGARIIYQATFFDEQFIGHADFLLRVEVPSDLGAWSYEAVDTKLALSTKPYFIVQLCNYSEHLMRLQGRMPDRGHIVLGDRETKAFRLHDYLAYYRHLKSRFLAFVGDPALASEQDAREYPLSCHHCSICEWDDRCTQRRVDDDHLSLVAWMRGDQTIKLEAAGITTVAALAAAKTPPPDMAPTSFEKLRKQASLQVASRERDEPVYEIVAHDRRIGLGWLPKPDDGDVYFDMEGDPLYEPGRRLEYLFGCWLPREAEKFVAFWALNHDEERVAFERFVDFIVERRRVHPSMHVYHYAPYEKAALRRLAQEHSTRQSEVDELLRGEVLVDLYAVVRQSMMIGEDSYSIKRLERFYGMQRSTDVKKGDDSIVMFERWRASGDEKLLRDIENYNKDDCESTHRLHRWLLERRDEAIRLFGSDIPFRTINNDRCHDEPVDACGTCRARLKNERREARKRPLEQRLLRGIVAPRTDEEYERLGETLRSRYLMGHVLAYHRNEANPVWWALFDRCENIDELLDRDKEAIGGLTYCADIPPFKAGRDRNFTYTYRFPEQHHKMHRGGAHDPRTGQSAGEIVELDDDNGILRLKRAGDEETAAQITALIPGGPIPTEAQQDSLLRIGELLETGGLASEFPATFDLLTGRNPRLVSGATQLQPRAVDAASVSAVARDLDRSYLFIQGPPGTGKSTIGSAVICDLLQAGKRVGVMSTGHKAIHNLLHMVEARMAERGGRFSGLYKHGTGDDSVFTSKLPEAYIRSVGKPDAFDGGGYDLAGGTAWLFAREELTMAFDYLFIDEAGQVSLADALAVSTCANNVVLLGDPLQLAQVSQGSHAPHVAGSILQHLLGDSATVPPDRGVFLDISYRMHPGVCSFISESMYDARLRAGDKTARHCVSSSGLDGAGLRYVPVEHVGNESRSEEEADRIVAEIARLLEGTITDDDGIARQATGSDVIVVTPYNAQRKIIAARLKNAGIDVEVGTVDKFQGQQAAVVFYSMATSSGEDVPRDLDFLFESNRFNVAISRARAMSVLVCSPRLLDVQCRSVEQMALVNTVCAFVESAEEALCSVGEIRAL